MEDHTYTIPPKKAVQSEPPSAKKRKRHEAKRNRDRRRGKTRVSIGAAFTRWKSLMEDTNFKTDAQVASFLLDSYLRTRTENPTDHPPFEPSSPSESCGSMDEKNQFTMISPDEIKEEAPASPLVQTPENSKESQKEAVCQVDEELMTSNQSENNDNSDVPEDEDDEVSISLSVGDGRYLVDLGSPSEFIIDEGCILQLFKTCRECSRQCSVRKQVKGLKIVVSQKCCFCHNSFKWTNLPDDDEEDDS